MAQPFLLSAATCFLFPLLAQAGTTVDVPVDQLPRPAFTMIKEAYADADVLHVRKEVEDNKECYNVTLKQEGRVFGVYVSADGHVLTRKEEPVALVDVAGRLLGGVIFLLPPAMVTGLFFQWIVRWGPLRKAPIAAEWMLAWLGGSTALTIISMSMATVPREKDIPIVILGSVTWGAISASVLEVLVLSLQSARGRRSACRALILRFCLLGTMFAVLWIPVDIYSAQRVNEYLRAMAMKAPRPWGFR